MTEHNTPKLEVTQADRDAAEHWGTGPVYSMKHLAEAFARHRIEATRTANWSDAELAAIAALSERLDTSEHAVLRQALRLYQKHQSRLDAGETVTWSGDEQRAAEFAGPFVTRTANTRPEQVEAFANAILHGDEVHRAWLLEAAACWVAGKPLPSPRSTLPPADDGLREALAKELETAISLDAQFKSRSTFTASIDLGNRVLAALKGERQ